MDAFYVFIIHNDVWIYILCALGLFWYGSELVRALGILRRAMFGLERETGTRLRNNALFFIALLATIAGLVYYINSSIAPTLNPSLFRLPTPTPDIFATPLSSPTPLGTVENLAVPTPGLAPTVTLASQPNIPLIDEPVITDTQEIVVDGTPTAVPTPFVACTPDLTITGPATEPLCPIWSPLTAPPTRPTSASTNWPPMGRKQTGSGCRCWGQRSASRYATAFWVMPT